MSNEIFRDSLLRYCREAGYSLKALASELGLNPATLSRKLSGDKVLTNVEIKQMLKIMVEWGALNTQDEVLDLLALTRLSAAIYSPVEWNSPPFNRLELQKERHNRDIMLPPVDSNALPASAPRVLPKPIPLPNLLVMPKPTPELKINLPPQPNRFVGRQKELEAIPALLRQPDTRLVTLTGAGGTGKTRLALAAVATMLADFPDGVYFVPLAALNDGHKLAETIAHTLHLTQEKNQTVLQTLKDWLHNKQTLLVLDNFEQLVEAAPLLSELLNHSPKIKLLVTSRTVLKLYGEQEFGVVPLALPAKPETDFANLSRYDAVELFVERAKATKADFALTVENAPVVVEICALLDGLPLALELAASRLKLFTPVAMLKKLKEARLKFLTGGAQNLLPRQQTLYQTIEWSYKLLNPPEQMIFRLAAVFVDSFDYAALEYLTNYLKNLPDKLELLDVLASLVDKNMLKVVSSDSGLRFNMLETIRDYAREQLTASGTEAFVWNGYVAYFLDLVAAVDLQGTNQANWLNRLEADHYNFQAVLDYCLQEPTYQEASLQLGAVLALFWRWRGYLAEGRQYLKRILAYAAALRETPLYQQVLIEAGNLANDQSDYKVARQFYVEALGIARQTDNQATVATVLLDLGRISHYQGDFSDAKKYWEECLGLRRGLNDIRGVASVLANLGAVAMHTNEYAKAREYQLEGLALSRQLQDKFSTAKILNNLGAIASDNFEYDAAYTYYQECLALRRELGDRTGIGMSLSNLGILETRRGNFVAARRYFEESLPLRAELGNRRGVVKTRLAFAKLFLQEQNYPQAKTMLRQNLTETIEIGAKMEIAGTIEGLAEIAFIENRPEKAVKLLGFATLLREQIQSPIEPVDLPLIEKLFEALRSVIVEEKFAQLLFEGKLLSLEQIISLLG